MKLIKLLKEIKITGQQPNQFLKVFLDIAIKKYPNSNWQVQSADTVRSVEEESANAASLIAWSIKVPVANPTDSTKLYYVGPAIQDAFTRDYTGVLGKAIKIHIDNLLSQHPDSLPALFIVGENWNWDAWDYIATKYGLQLIEDDNWEDYVEVPEDEDDDEQADALLQTLP